MMEPPPEARMDGAVAAMPRYTPRWLTATTRSKASMSPPMMGVNGAMPALLTRMSNCPNRDSASSTAALQLEGSVTSRYVPTAASPSSLVTSLTSSSTSPATTVAPALTSAAACAAPWPRAAPLTIAVLPASRIVWLPFRVPSGHPAVESLVCASVIV